MIIFLLGIVLVSHPLPSISQPSNQVFVGVNPSVSVKQLSIAQLRRIFTMRQNNWPNGDPITVFVLNTNNSYHQYFTKSVLDLFPYQLERLWNKLVYSGQGERPIMVSDMLEMQQRVANTPGAIGYFSGLDKLININLVNIKEEK
ncbi:substrate-binding domain-containing protein [Neptunicella sp.]|uniref:substrate-binding domain-containing protein n=1 Tax=Neptunicella sp. TaxID=2125986 RepID=UPI003F69140C